jgi:hypothetical protein
MSKIFYEKIGDKYFPVSEYDSDMSHSFPHGSHLVTVQPGISMRRSNIDPAFAPLIAACIYAEDTIVTALRRHSDLRPSVGTVTQEQRDAWNNLAQAFGDERHALTWPAAVETVRDTMAVLQDEANKLLSNPAVKNAYDEFMLICKETK